MRQKVIEQDALRMLEVWFKTWTVTFEQEARMKKIRKSGFDFARTLVEVMNQGSDRDKALFQVRLAVMLARDAIANETAHGEA